MLSCLGLFNVSGLNVFRLRIIGIMKNEPLIAKIYFDLLVSFVFNMGGSMLGGEKKLQYWWVRPFTLDGSVFSATLWGVGSWTFSVF